ncbi:MAG: sensor histidine kinase [Micromonosporaceae bacterium]
MTRLAVPMAEIPVWVVRRGPWFLAVLVTTPVAVVVVASIWNTENSLPAPPPRSDSPLLAISLALMLWGLQLRHSLAAARGVRPAGWPVSLLALTLLALVPWWWFSVNWISALWFPLTSAVMCLPRRAAVAVTASALTAMGAVAGYATAAAGGGVFDVVSMIAFNTIAFGFGVVALYGSALLVKQISALFDTRAELATAAVSGERQRMSRDLHDLLGQSLSAIALKGDLALRLVPADHSAALAEVREITGIARRTQEEVRAIARAEHRISLDAELDGAVALLEAGGIQVNTRLHLPSLPGPVNALLAWVVREATTNILRHSHAQRCWLNGSAAAGLVRMEIVNDGAAPAPSAGGTGLTGLADRAHELGGRAHQRYGRDRFRLSVEVPVAVPPAG